MRTILIPLDGSPFAEQALPPACSLARHAGAALVLLRVAPYSSPTVGPASPLRVTVRDAETYLRPLRERLTRQGFTVVTRVFKTDPVSGILFGAKMHGANLIAMSTHGRSGLFRLVLGSVAEQVLHRSPLPVLLMRPTGSPPARVAAHFRRILVPLDGTLFAETALAYLVREGLVGTAEVVLLQAITGAHAPWIPGINHYPADSAGERLQLDADQREAARHYLADVAGRYLRGVPHRVQVVVDHAPSAILETAAAQDVDLVVMASHGRTGIDRLRHGSVAEHVLHHALVPTLLVHGSAASELPETAPVPIGEREVAGKVE